MKSEVKWMNAGAEAAAQRFGESSFIFFFSARLRNGFFGNGKKLNKKMEKK